MSTHRWADFSHFTKIWALPEFSFNVLMNDFFLSQMSQLIWMIISEGKWIRESTLLFVRIRPFFIWVNDFFSKHCICKLMNPALKVDRQIENKKSYILSSKKMHNRCLKLQNPFLFQKGAVLRFWQLPLFSPHLLTKVVPIKIALRTLSLIRLNKVAF